MKRTAFLFGLGFSCLLAWMPGYAMIPTGLTPLAERTPPRIALYLSEHPNVELIFHSWHSNPDGVHVAIALTYPESGWVAETQVYAFVEREAKLLVYAMGNQLTPVMHGYNVAYTDLMPTIADEISITTSLDLADFSEKKILDLILQKADVDWQFSLTFEGRDFGIFGYQSARLWNQEIEAFFHPSCRFKVRDFLVDVAQESLLARIPDAEAKLNAMEAAKIKSQESTEL